MRLRRVTISNTDTPIYRFPLCIFTKGKPEGIFPRRSRHEERRTRAFRDFCGCREIVDVHDLDGATSQLRGSVFPAN